MRPTPRENSEAMTAEAEIRAGNRFGFGANWARFLLLVNEKRILSAEESLQDMIGTASLAGRKAGPDWA